MLLQALRVEIEMINLNLQVGFLVQKGMGKERNIAEVRNFAWHRFHHQNIFGSGSKALCA